jgi:phage tail-like protein
MTNWIGRGKGRSASQPTLSLSSGPGMGSGRSGTQPTMQAATGQSLSSWSGRGGGRPGAQPQLQPAMGKTMNDWTGRGGGRAGAQPVLQPATGKNMNNWVGRGGGRSPIQPKIQSASIIAAQRAVQHAMSNMVAGAMQSVGGALGGFFSQSSIGGVGRSLEDPIGGYVFALEINGMEVAHFTECSGIKSSTEVYTIKEGGMNHAVHKLPGQSTWENIVLKYGVTSDMSMLSLREFIMNDNYGSAGGGIDMGNLSGGLSTNTSVTSMINAAASAISGALNGSSGGMQDKRFSGSIVLKNNHMQEMVRYSFQQAWIVGWEGPKLGSESSTLAIESVEIAHHGVNVSRAYASKLPI